MILFPDRRTIIALGTLKVYWYGFLYVLSFVIGLFVALRLQRFRNLFLTRDQWLEVITLGAIGAVIGGRVGYAVFYEPALFLNPWQLVSIWSGGMSSHGGFIGVSLAIWYISRKLKLSWLALLDIIVIPASIGLALGRIGNFINYELYGTVTSLPWGVIIPDVPGLRHPVQIYASLLALITAGIAYVFLKKTTKPGYVTAVFLLVYSLSRLYIERFREPLHVVFNLKNILITTEDILTFLVAGVGIVLFVLIQQQKVPPPSCLSN